MEQNKVEIVMEALHNFKKQNMRDPARIKMRVDFYYGFMAECPQEMLSYSVTDIRNGVNKFMGVEIAKDGNDVEYLVLVE